MIHKICKYCGRVGHINEMDEFIDPGYARQELRAILKWGKNWYHKECFAKRCEDYDVAIQAMKDSRSKS